MHNILKSPQYAIDNDLRITRKSRVTNPDFDPNVNYTPRVDRPEWDAIGLMGKLWLKPGQITGDRWLKLKDGKQWTYLLVGTLIMPIKLNGATSGSVELDVPAAVGSDLQLTFPATAGTALVAPGSTSITVPSVNGTLDRLERAGNILQVVNQTYGAGLVTSSTSFVATGLAASITPSTTSSKILVLVSQTITPPTSGTNTFGRIALKKDSVIIFQDDRLNLYSQYAHSTYSLSLLNAPSTTSAVTYSMFMASGNSSKSIEAQHGSLRTSTMTLFEVAA